MSSKKKAPAKKPSADPDAEARKQKQADHEQKLAEETEAREAEREARRVAVALNRCKGQLNNTVTVVRDALDRIPTKERNAMLDDIITSLEELKKEE